MNWEAIEAIAEVIGAIAVLATLLYLARQIQQTGRYAKANTQQVLVDEYNRYFKELSGDETMRRRFRLAMRSWEQLPNDDRAAVHIYLASLINHFEQVYYLNETELVPDAVFDAFRRLTLAIILTEGGAEFWAECKGAFGTDICDYLDTQLTEGINLPPPLTATFPWFRADDP